MIRPARLSDLPALYAFASGLALDGAPDLETYARELRSALEDDRSLVLIAERDGVAVGSLVAGLLPMPMYGGPLAFLQELYVDEPARSAGIGAQLMAAFEAWSRERGAKVQALGTSRPGAMRFYERLGFVTRPTAYYFRRLGVTAEKSRETH